MKGLNKNSAQEEVTKVVYTREEVTEASKKYFGGSEQLANVWRDKYSLKKQSDDGKSDLFLEKTPIDMFHRIAGEIARVDSKYPNALTGSEIFDLLKDFKYIIPQGGPMSGVGNREQFVSLSNCFVIGNNELCDSYGGIFQIDQEQVQLMKRRGGVGHDISNLRPKNACVKNSARTSSGMVSFMERFSNSTQEVAQDGRRGALMLSVSVEHPDILHFINAKKTNSKITRANISVRATDNFMKAVESGTDYIQQYPVGVQNPTVTQNVNAKEIFDELVSSNWQSGDPGLLFWDTIIRESVPDCYADLGFKTVSTNPCGEIPLCAYDSCRLLAINLYSYVENPFTAEAEFDFDLFKKHAFFATKLMDDVIDLELEKIDDLIAKIDSDVEPEEVKFVERNLWVKIKDKAQKGRRTGIGHVGLADTHAALGIKYSSQEGIDFAVKMQKTLATEVYRASVTLAKERGAFPLYDFKREEKNPFIGRLLENAPELKEEMKQYGRRNIALLTIAPTGTTSMIASTSNGIEPVFSLLQVRKVALNTTDEIDENDKFVRKVGNRWWRLYIDAHPKLKNWCKINNYDVNKLIDTSKISNSDLDANQVITELRITSEEGEEIVKKSPYYKSTAYDLDYKFRVKMQGAVQKWVDHSISSTINFPEDIEESVIADAYMEAWKAGCKGITVFRDRCKDEKFLEANPRPTVLECEVHTFEIGEEEKKEKWIAFVGIKDNKPYEIFTGKYNPDFLPGVFVNLDKLKNVDYNFDIVKATSEDKKETDYVFNYSFKEKPGHYSETFMPDGKIVISRLFNKEFWNYAILISHLLRQGAPVTKIVSTIDRLKFKENGVDWNTWKHGIKKTLSKYIKNGASASVCPTCGSPRTWEGGCTKGPNACCVTCD